LFIIYGLISTIISFFSINLLLHTHWTVKRSNLAKEYFKKAEHGKFEVINNSLIIMLPDKEDLDELKITLNGNKAMRLILNNNTLNTVYLEKTQ